MKHCNKLISLLAIFAIISSNVTCLSLRQVAPVQPQAQAQAPLQAQAAAPQPPVDQQAQDSAALHASGLSDQKTVNNMEIGSTQVESTTVNIPTYTNEQTQVAAPEPEFQIQNQASFAAPPEPVVQQVQAQPQQPQQLQAQAEPMQAQPQQAQPVQAQPQQAGQLTVANSAKLAQNSLDSPITPNYVNEDVPLDVNGEPIQQQQPQARVQAQAQQNFQVNKPYQNDPRMYVQTGDYRGYNSATNQPMQGPSSQVGAPIPKSAVPLQNAQIPEFDIHQNADPKGQTEQKLDPNQLTQDQAQAEKRASGQGNQSTYDKHPEYYSVSPIIENNIDKVQEPAPQA